MNPETPRFEKQNLDTDRVLTPEELKATKILDLIQEALSTQGLDEILPLIKEGKVVVKEGSLKVELEGPHGSDIFRADVKDVPAADPREYLEALLFRGLKEQMDASGKFSTANAVSDATIVASSLEMGGAYADGSDWAGFLHQYHHGK